MVPSETGSSLEVEIGEVKAREDQQQQQQHQDNSVRSLPAQASRGPYFLRATVAEELRGWASGTSEGEGFLIHRDVAQEGIDKSGWGSGRSEWSPPIDPLLTQINTLSPPPSSSGASSGRSLQAGQAEMGLALSEQGSRSRWKEFNPTEQMMRQWEAINGIEQRRLTPPAGGGKLLTIVEGQTVVQSPIRNELERLPDNMEENGEWWSVDDELAVCSESREGGICGNHTRPGDRCRCLDHAAVSAHGVFVCDECSQQSIDILVNPQGSPISADELLGMRAYLCGNCASKYSHKTDSMLLFWLHGATHVWGSRFGSNLEINGKVLVNGDEIEFHSNSLPATGCSCGSKIFQQRLCRYHRLQLAEKALRQVSLMKNWLLATFGNPLCPGCLLIKPVGQANLSTEEPDGMEGSRGPEAWACLLCNGLVINQSCGRKLVPGWEQWFSQPPEGWS